MSNLIITIVAILLAAIMVVAAFMWGGSAAQEKAAFEVSVEQSVSELNQLRGALITYHAMNGEWATDLSDLVPNFLRQLPEGWESEGLKGLISMSSEVDEDSCKRINERLTGQSIAPQCTDTNDSFMGCCNRTELLVIDPANIH